MPHPENPRAKTRPHRHSRHRTDRGLTTLEWLLIVAAVAGLAALAVVLVQNVVDDTAEQISGSSARLTAALVAAQEITEDCKPSGGGHCAVGTDDTVIAESKAKCERLQITYGDALDDAQPTAMKPYWTTVVISANDNKKQQGENYTTSAAATPGCHILDT